MSILGNPSLNMSDIGAAEVSFLARVARLKIASSARMK
jgi:hypothetical protein